MKIVIPYQLALLNEHFGLDIQPSNLDRTHRISSKNKAHKTGRAITIKFTRYNIRKKVFMKKKLKGIQISVTDGLTSLRMKKLKDSRDEFGVIRFGLQMAIIW